LILLTGPFFQVIMLLAFEQKVADVITSSGLFPAGRKVLLAVSGGADSVALLNVVYKLYKESAIVAEIVVGHINHQLRGQAAVSDEEFVKVLGRQFGLEVITRSVDVAEYAKHKKLSVEMAGRQVRRKVLSDIAKERGCDLIATGHHADDNAETMIHRLQRGTGFRGLGGIWPKRKFQDGTVFVRPLLCVGRGEIIEYCSTAGLKWQDDKTNDELVFRRNLIRHKLLPKLERESTVSIAEELSRLSQSCRRFYMLVCKEVESAWDELIAESTADKVVLNSKPLSRQCQPVQIETVRRGLVEIGSGEMGLTEYHYKRIIALAKSGSGKRIELPGRFSAVSDYGKIVLQKRCVGKLKAAEKPLVLEIPGKGWFGGYAVEARLLDAKNYDLEKFKAEKNEFVEWFDFDRIRGPLTIRRRKAGDKFWPLGLGREKKIGKFLTAERLSSELRDEIIVVSDSEKIIWLGPVRASELTKISGQTSEIVEIRASSGPDISK